MQVLVPCATRRPWSSVTRPSAVAIEAGPAGNASGVDALAEAAATAFRSWQDALTAGLVSAGATAGRAGGVATLIVASVEGATILCRARRSLAPLDDVVAELEDLIGAACDAGP